MPQRPASLPFGFNSWEEFDTWQSDLHSAIDSAEKTSKTVDILMAQGLAKEANKTGLPDLVKQHIPGEVIDALKQVKRIEGFLPFLPDAEVPYWSQLIVRYLSIVATFFGV